ncbi:MAG: molecular chaperone DnaK [Thermoplasmata archaeon]
MSKILGIDLGTTNSVAAVMEGGEPIIIPNAEGNRTTPSVVAFKEDDERLVGELAKRQAVKNPERTVASIKRKMGSDHKVTIGDKEYTPEEISAMILQKLKKDSEDYLGTKLERAVITVPAYFNEPQREATKTAGEIAGFKVERVFNEPTASAMAYKMDEDKAETILVYDLGGGTFDVSILELGDGVYEVLATSGNTKLGGDDWTQRIVDWCVDKFKKQTGIDLSKDRGALQRVVEASEKAKIELSSREKTEINLPYITVTEDGPEHLDMDLTHGEFQNMTADLVDKTKGPVKQAMDDAGLNPSNIDEVILVGGSTRLRAVRDFVEDYFGKKPHMKINPDECVAIGAAVQAGIISGDVKDDIVLLDVTPLTLGVETLGGVVTPLIDKNTTIPTEESKVFTTAQDNQTSVDIHVVQGERAMAKDNHSLGRFQLTGIPPAPRGVPQIEVNFKMDENGILNVEAEDKGTGKKNSITVVSTGQLDKDEIDRMKKEAERYAEEDKRKQKEILEKNEATTMVGSAERTLEEFSDKIDDSLKNEIQQKIDDLRGALDKDDLSLIKEKKDELAKKLSKIGEQMYQEQAAQQAAQQQAQEGEAQTDEEGYVDADYEVVEEE